MLLDLCFELVLSDESAAFSDELGRSEHWHCTCTMAHLGQTGPGGSAPAIQSVSDILYGERSLTERFGTLEGRELQAKIFESYMALWLSQTLLMFNLFNVVT